MLALFLDLTSISFHYTLGQNSVCVLLDPNFCYMSCQFHPLWIEHSKNVWQEKDCEAPQQVVFSNILLFSSCLVQTLRVAKTLMLQGNYRL